MERSRRAVGMELRSLPGTNKSPAALLIKPGCAWQRPLRQGSAPLLALCRSHGELAGDVAPGTGDDGRMDSVPYGSREVPAGATARVVLPRGLAWQCRLWELGEQGKRKKCPPPVSLPPTTSSSVTSIWIPEFRDALDSTEIPSHKPALCPVWLSRGWTCT